jgi:hypothetical protein
MIRMRRTLTFLSLMALAACGGGGGGGGGSAPPPSSGYGNDIPPASGPGDAENFFPTTLASSWNYYATLNNSQAAASVNFLDSVTVTGTQSVNGHIATVFQESNPSGAGMPVSGYYLKNAGGVAYLGTSDVTDKVSPKIVPYVLALFPAAIGTVAKFDKTRLDYGTDLDGDGINETFNVSVTNTIDGFEPLALGIGTFSRTAKATESISGTVILSKTNTSVPFSGSASRWLAPGVGVLKSSQTATAQSGTTTVTSTVDMEVRGYVVSDGVTTVAHGLGMPFPVASGLASGNGDPSMAPGAPGLASNGDNFLAVSGTSSAVALGPILGQLIDGQGKLIKTLSLAVGDSPVAAFDGANYWVVYSNQPASGPGCFAQRVTPSGTVLDASPIVVSTTSSCGSHQNVAFSGGNGLVVYSHGNLYPHDLYGTLVGLDGTVQGAEFPIAADVNDDHVSPVVAFDGVNYLVVWQQADSRILSGNNNLIYAARVSQAGVVLDTAGIAISTGPMGQMNPSVAFDGSNYLIAWVDQRAQLSGIYGARLSPGGALLDGAAGSSGIQIGTGGPARILDSPYVAYTGSEYLVAWDSRANPGEGIYAARVSTSATLPSGTGMQIVVSGPAPTTTDSLYVFPTIAVGKSAALLVWLDNARLVGSQKALVGVTVAPF